MLERFKDEKEIVIIGGGEVYKSFAPYITKVYQTHIPHVHDNDIRMEVECDDWDLVYHDSRLGEGRPYFQIFEKMGINDELVIEVRKY